MEAPIRPFSVQELRAVKAVEDHFDIGIQAASASRDSLELHTPAPKSLQRRRSRFPLMALAIAATLLVALFLSSSYWNGDEEIAAELPTPDAALAVDGVVARIVRKIDCDWEQDRWNIAPSTSIVAGQKVSISRGLLTLEFESGAELTLNGPVDL